METGARELKDNLSRCISANRGGERVVVVITPPVEEGDPLEDCPEIRVPKGTAAAMIDSDRGEA